jgi:hypothetical protein
MAVFVPWPVKERIVEEVREPGEGEPGLEVVNQSQAPREGSLSVQTHVCVGTGAPSEGQICFGDKASQNGCFQALWTLCTPVDGGRSPGLAPPRRVDR